jgi:hypothetical protein
VGRLEDQGRLVEPAVRKLLAVGTRAADEQLAALGECLRHLLLERFPLGLRVQRADHRAAFRSGAELQFRHLAPELLDELVCNPLVHVQALDRKTRLPAVEEAADARRADRAVDVSVVEHDHRVRATELERDAFHSSRGELSDAFADRGRSREGDLCDARIGDESLTEHRAPAGHHLEHTVR